MKTPISSIVLVSIAALFSAVGQIFYKLAANRLTDIWSFILNPYVYVGILCYGAGFIFVLKALLKGEVTTIYPIMASSFIWVALSTAVIFNDSMSLVKWAGIVIIILGIWAVAKGGQE